MIKLYVLEIEDKFSQDNFRRIEQEFRDQAMLHGQWKFFDIEIAAAVTDYRYRHRLGICPKDIIQTSLVGPGALTWHFADFTKDFLFLTTTGACRVRAFIGTYEEGVI